MAIPQGFTIIQQEPRAPSGFTVVEEERESNDLQDFTRKSAADFQRRSQMAMEIIEAQSQGEQTWAETALQLTGKVGIGLASDIIFNGVVEGVQALTPDAVGENVTDFATHAAYKILDNPVGKRGLEALYDGAEAYQSWKQSNPRMARNLEGVVNIGLVWTPTKGNPNQVGAGLRNLPKRMVDRTKGLADDIQRNIASTSNRGPLAAASSRLQRSATNKFYLERQARILDAMIPDEGLSSNTKLLERGKLSSGGFMRDAQFIPDNVDKSALNDILALTNGRSQNARQVFNESKAALGKLENQMRGYLRGGKKQVYSPDDLIRAMDEVRAATAKQNAMLVGSEQVSAINTMFDDILDIASQHPRTAKGLLMARRKYDDLILETKPNIFNVDSAGSAMKNTNLAIRQRVNEMVSDMVPQASGLLKRQSNIFKVQNTIMRNAALEPRKWIGSQLAKLNGMLGTRSLTTNIIAGILGVGGLGAAALGAPIWTFGIAAPFVAYKGGKMALSSTARKAYSDIIRATDVAIKNTLSGATELGKYGTKQTVDLLTSLKADRAALIQLLEEGQE